MKSRVFRARLSVLPLACAAAFPATAQSDVSLTETVVTATRFAAPIDTLPIGVSVITARDIRESGATTVNEAVMRLLGVSGRLDLYGGGNYSLDLRGFGETAGSNQVVVLDGVRLNESDLGTARLSGIPIDAIERIEILRGSGAVLYGEGATGGVIVITTKAGVGKERSNSATVYGGLGSNSLREVRGAATVASGGFSLDLYGQRRDSDNHRDNFRSESQGGGLTAQWSNDFLRLGLRHSEDGLDTGLPGALSLAEFEQDPSQTNTPNDWARIRNKRDSVFAEAELGEWQVAAEAGWREKALRSEWSASAYGYDIDASNYGLRGLHETRLGTMGNQLTIGHDYSHWERLSFGSLSNHKSRAWYLRDELSLSKDTRLSAGWRTERIDKGAYDGSAQLSDRQQAWEFGLSQSLSSASRVWARVGKSFRLANVDEFSFTNPSVAIRPQTSRDLEAGWGWEQGAYQLEARLYRSALTDEIGYDPNAVNPLSWSGLGANVNFDPTRRQGLEFDGRWTVNRALALNAHLNLRSAQFRSGSYAGKAVPLVARETLALQADWAPSTGHLVSGRLNWVGSQHADFANQCRIPSYTVVDARYAYQWDGVELSLGVKNLFDRQYYTLAYGCSGGLPTSVYPEAGRSFVAAVRMAF